MTDGRPDVSVVLRVIEGPSGITQVVDALRRQAPRARLEIIVPVAAGVAAALPPACRDELEIVEIPESDDWAALPPASAVHARCDVGSTMGLAAARGRVLASLEDTAVPSNRWVDRVVDLHASHPHEAIGGPIDVDAGDALAWAAFWLDFGPYVPPQPAGEVAGLSDVNVSYKRDAFFSTEAVWREQFNEYLVHRAFAARGYRFLMAPDLAVTLRRPRRPAGVVLSERYHWGRVFGAARRASVSGVDTAAHVLATPVLPLVVAARAARRAAGTAGHAARARRSLPALLACGSAWCAGELIGQVSGRAFRSASPSRASAP